MFTQLGSTDRQSQREGLDFAPRMGSPCRLVAERILDKISEQENIVNLSKIIESSFESSFQFFFQTVFLWPTIIFTVSNMQLSGAVTDLLALFDKRTFSIVLSFGTLAFSFYAIR